MQIIGIHGKKHTGKDTLAGLMVKYAREPVQLIAFADHLKSVCSTLFSLPLSSFYSEDLKEQTVPAWGMSPRGMMTLTSDTIKTMGGPDFFIKVVKSRLPHLGTDHVIITDVRYELEAKMIRSSGGRIIHISRDTQVQDSHASEQGIAIDPRDYLVDNNGSMGNLEYLSRTALLFCGW